MSLSLYGKAFSSRLLLGTARYPSLAILEEAIHHSGVEIITVSLRRQTAQNNESMRFWSMIQSLGCHVLPNTAGCQSATEAIMVAEMARSLFNTNWIKLEVTCDDYTLQPNCFELVSAAKELIAQGFEVFPYTTDDLHVCEHLAALGCEVIMPMAAPIGSGKGLNNPFALKLLRQRLPNHCLIVDAGIGAPSHAAFAMELGYDAILLNTAVALASSPKDMASAFAKTIEASHLAYQAGLMPVRDFATPSTPIVGKPFWHQNAHE
jgi:thiazole synthase